MVVVDDGSTDAVAEMLKRFSDSRLRVIKHSQNKGAAAARNTAIKASKGMMIAFLDSDDEWHPHKLEKQLLHFDEQKRKNPKIRGSFTWFFLQREKDKRELRKFIPVKNWKEYFLNGCFISPGSTLLVDKNVYDSVGYYEESFKRFEDWEWLLRFSTLFDLAVCKIPLSSIYQGIPPSYQVVYPATQKLRSLYLPILPLNQQKRLLSSCYMELAYSLKKTHRIKASYFLCLAISMNPFLLKKCWNSFFKILALPTRKKIDKRGV